MTPEIVLAQTSVFRINSDTTLRNALVVVAASIVIAISAQLAVWLPFTPVPITGQSLAVIALGILLGSKRGSLAVLAYIGQGAAGFPVFASGRSSIAVLFGPTGGYILGFVFAAWFAGLIVEKGGQLSLLRVLLAIFVGTIMIYATGLLQLSCFVSSGILAHVGLYPFVIGECVKILFCAAVVPCVIGVGNHLKARK